MLLKSGAAPLRASYDANKKDRNVIFITYIYRRP